MAVWKHTPHPNSSHQELASVSAPLESRQAGGSFDQLNLTEVTLCDFWSRVLKVTHSSPLFTGALFTQSYHVTSPNALRLPCCEEAQTTWRCFWSIVLFFPSSQPRGQMCEWKCLRMIPSPAVESPPPLSLPSWSLRHHGAATGIPCSARYYESWTIESVSVRKWVF